MNADMNHNRTALSTVTEPMFAMQAGRFTAPIPQWAPAGAVGEASTICSSSSSSVSVTDFTRAKSTVILTRSLSWKLWGPETFFANSKVVSDMQQTLDGNGSLLMSSVPRKPAYGRTANASGNLTTSAAVCMPATELPHFCAMAHEKGIPFSCSTLKYSPTSLPHRHRPPRCTQSNRRRRS